ncbi:hypothetical protein DPMN_188712 [Dreissena polymorpha]|uniref:Reverse transcriptase zinc-binding domain-containing protein n=1 Tax=Dreissena polymorpha TaxID=45954 RepID=A0A9D4DUA1_DREPO|nr:hypothetical protein DPMN_188712 [Dreissena polymorpha]
MNIARLPESVEYKILRRQLLMAEQDSKTLASNARKILEKYNLPTPKELLEEVPTKDKWKKMFKKASNDYWENTWRQELATQSTMKYLQVQHPVVDNPHNLWKSTCPKQHEVQRAEIKARLITGTFILQTNAMKFNKSEVSATCKLCGSDDETREHLLGSCSALSQIREENLTRLNVILSNDNIFTTITQDSGMLIQIILDCTHSSLKDHVILSRDQETDIERWSQAYCERLITHRAQIISSK